MSVEEKASRLADPAAKLRFLRTAARRRNAIHPWLAAACLPFALFSLSPPARTKPAPPLLPPPPKLAAAAPPERVLLIERSSSLDLYSNGLQIRSAYQTVSTPRAYRSYSRSSLTPSATQSTPAGIVFHTTESLLPPIEEKALRAVTRTRDDLLAYIRNGRYYNFVIDRFGQVFRIVPENQTAFHAGHSVWANPSSVFLDLNDSFLGVSFEMRAGETATAAQTHAARLLTAMLRGAFNIPDANCVTHAQVSVNPDNLRIGYHTDWGGSFPFREAGLTAGYSAPVAAIELFGFNYDERLLGAIGGRPWDGILSAEREILNQAGARGLTPARYRANLQQQYQALRRHNHDRS